MLINPFTISLIRGKLTPYAALARSYAALRQRPRSHASTPSDLETHAEDLKGKRTQNAAWCDKILTLMISPACLSWE